MPKFGENMEDDIKADLSNHGGIAGWLDSLSVRNEQHIGTGK